MFLQHTSNRKARILLTVGLLSLALSAGSYAFSLTFGLSASPLHFLRGFFLGLSIVFNIAALLSIAQNRRATKS
jgi:hypothetical protein